MRCQDAEHALSLHLNERAGGLLPSALDEHLADCPACRAEWAALQQVDTLFVRARMAAPPAGFLDAVMARIEMEAERVTVAPAHRRWLRRRHVLGTSLVMGTLLLLGLAAGSFVWGLIIYGLGILTLGWLQSPQVVNATHSLLQQASFWVTTLCSTLGTVVGAMLPWLAFGALAFVFLSILAYTMTLAWAWLIGRVWWTRPVLAVVEAR
jgi:anti-sigma factor RsiW